MFKNKIKNLHGIQVIEVLWPFLWPKEKGIRYRFLGAFLVILVSTALSILVPIFLKLAVGALEFSKLKNQNFIFLITGLYGIVWMLSKISVTLRQVLMFPVMEKGIMMLSVHIFEHLHNLSYDFHVKRKTGEIISAIEKAQRAFPAIIWPLFFLIIPTLLEVLAVSILLSYLYGLSYGIIMIATICLFLGFSLKTLKWSLQALRQSNENYYKANSNIVDSLINFSTIRIFNSQTYEFEKCRNLLQRNEDSQVKALMRGRFVCLGQDIIIGFALTIFSLMCAYSVLYRGYNVSDFVLINSYVIQFSVPLASLGFIIGEFQGQLTHMEKVIELLKRNQKIQDGTCELEVNNKKVNIELRDVRFGYSSKRLILKDVSFKLNAGETVAIVGPTGSGKSTITHLLMRFYEQESGQILINGQDLQTLKRSSYLDHIGTVPQDIALFNDTLKNNITYGNRHVSEQEIQEVIELTLLDALVHSLPAGLETVVGERGLALSTGEKQRLGIARVLLKHPSLYIFDEATSALDVKTEQRIMYNIRKKTQSASVLIIAHRLSTVKHADKILVFQNGTITESGSHAELIHQNGFYANLCGTQAVAV